MKRPANAMVEWIVVTALVALFLGFGLWLWRWGGRALEEGPELPRVDSEHAEIPAP